MADARTTRILETALWRFALQGVHATTTAEIARLAGVGVGTLFRSFASKEQLLQAVAAQVTPPATPAGPRALPTVPALALPPPRGEAQAVALPRATCNSLYLTEKQL